MSWLLGTVACFALILWQMSRRKVSRLEREIIHLNRSPWGGKVEFKGTVSKAIFTDGYEDRYSVGEGWGAEYFNLPRCARLSVGDEVIFTVATRQKTEGEA